MKVRYLVDTTIGKPGLTPDQVRQLRLGGAPQSAYRCAVKRGEVRDVSEDEAKSVIRTGVAVAADPEAAKFNPAPDKQIDALIRANVGMGAGDPKLNASSPVFQDNANAAIQQRLDTASTAAAAEAA